MLETVARSKQTRNHCGRTKASNSRKLSTAQDSTTNDSTPQRNPPISHPSLFSLLSYPSIRCFTPKISQIISGKCCQEIIMVASKEFGGLLRDPGCALPEFLEKKKVGNHYFLHGWYAGRSRSPW